jgi:hypothetical protein
MVNLATMAEIAPTAAAPTAARVTGNLDEGIAVLVDLTMGTLPPAHIA